MPLHYSQAAILLCSRVLLIVCCENQTDRTDFMKVALELSIEE